MPFGNDSAFPLHDDQIKKWAERGWEFDFFKARASASRSFEFHDFTNSIAADVTNKWTISATSTATTWAALAEPGGWIRGVTGASVATAALQIYSPSKFWNGTAGAGFASRIRLSAVTDIRLEQGFVDVSPANAITAVNVASNTFNSVTTGAVYLFDNGTASAAISGLYTIGVSTAFQSVATTTNRYTSAASLWVSMEIYGSTVKLWLGPPAGSPTAVIHSAFAATEAWIAWVGIKALGATKNVDIDSLVTWTVDRV